MAWGDLSASVYQQTRSGRKLGECFEKNVKKKVFRKNLDFHIFFIFLTMLAYGDLFTKMTFVHFDHDSRQMLKFRLIMLINGPGCF